MSYEANLSLEHDVFLQGLRNLLVILKKPMYIGMDERGSDSNLLMYTSAKINSYEKCSSVSKRACVLVTRMWVARTQATHQHRSLSTYKCEGDRLTMAYGVSSEVGSRSAGQEIVHLLLNPIIHYRVQKSPKLDAALHSRPTCS